MKTALYLRCSTDMQEMSIPDQRRILRKYCREKGYEIVTEFQDEGISGTTFEKRPGAMRLFQTVQSGRHDFTRVVILNESRFGRVPNTKEAIHYEFVLEKAGVSVEYAQSESNLPGAPGLIMRAVKYEQAAEFSKQLSKDVIRGQSTAAGKGYSTGGFPPLGYARMVCDENGNDLQALAPGQRKAVKNHWVRWIPGDPRDVALVNRIFSLYVYGGKGIKAICKTLNEEGIPSPKGRLWGPDVVHAILHNRAYIGERVYGGRWARKVTEKVVAKNAHEPIVPLDLFDKAQACALSRRELGRFNFRGMRSSYLLSGKIVCNDCGYKFQGRKVKNNQGRVYEYYVDAGYLTYKTCKPLSLPKDTKGSVIGIEDFVISEIQRILETDRYVERFKEYLKESLIGLERETKTVYPVLSKKLNAVNKEIESLVDELLALKSDALRERLRKREAERDELKKELAKYESVKNEPSKVLLLVNEYAKVLKNVGEVLKRRTPGEQKTAIGYFLDRIEVVRSEGVARCYFFDFPRPREAEYLIPGETGAGSRVCQVWCRRKDTPPEIHASRERRQYIVVDFPLVRVA